MSCNQEKQKTMKSGREKGGKHNALHNDRFIKPHLLHAKPTKKSTLMRRS